MMKIYNATESGRLMALRAEAAELDAEQLEQRIEEARAKAAAMSAGVPGYTQALNDVDSLLIVQAARETSD